jgi:hypothetical protein
VPCLPVVVESRFHHESVAAEHREIRASISDLAEHSVDDAKADLLADNVVERIHPSIVRAMEKEDFNAERILARVDSLDMSKKSKPKKFCQHAAGPQPLLTTPAMENSTIPHEANLQLKMDLMGGKIERLVAVHSRNEGLHISTQKSIDQILAKQRKLRDDMSMVINNQHVLSGDVARRSP